MAKKRAKKASKKRSKKVVEKAAVQAANKEKPADENKGGLTIETGKDQAHQSAKIKPGKRLYLNAAKDTLYPEGHLQAASLYCTEHGSVLRAEFDALKKAN